MSNELPPRSSEPPVGGWPGIIGAIGKFLGGLTTERALIYFLMVFIGFYVWTDRADRKDIAAASLRSAEDVKEKDRLAVDTRVDKLLNHCNQSNKESITAFEKQSDAWQKKIEDQTKAIIAFTVEMQEWRRMWKNKPEDEPVAAPQPRPKTIVP